MRAMTAALDPDKLRLGKQDYVHDRRTLQARMLLEGTLPDVPKRFDLGARRRPMPLGLWGNNDWGNCVKVAEYNHLVRLARLDNRRTLPVTTEMVVGDYMRATGAQAPGDAQDHGLVMLYNFKDLKNTGLSIATGKKSSFDASIAAYGEVHPADHAVARAGCYLLGGIQFGISLPWTAAEQMRNGEPWDDTGSTGADADEGSWGGHAVYSFKFDENGWWVVTWGLLQRVTNRFMERYADEGWVMVDKIAGKWWLPQDKLMNYFNNLHPIG